MFAAFGNDKFKSAEWVKKYERVYSGGDKQNLFGREALRKIFNLILICFFFTFYVRDELPTQPVP